MYLLGFDIGGTKCAYVLAEWDGNEIKLLKKEKCPTVLEITPEKMIEKLMHMADASLDRKPDAIGISCGGPLDSMRGIIMGPPNLPGWDDVEIVKIVESHYGVKARLQNDANACALAEWRFGAGRGCENMIFLTFGTGLGAGLILDGKLYEGTNGNAGEVGHIRLEESGPVGFCKEGSFEGFCSGGGIAQLGYDMAIESLERGESVAYFSEGMTKKEVTAASVAEAARDGDRTALEVYRVSGEKLGRGLSLLIDTLNPQRIVIGSIFARSGELLYDAMKKEIEKEALGISSECCEIVSAALGESIGDYAAIATALECQGQPSDGMLGELIVRYPSLANCQKEIGAAAEMLIDTFKGGGKLLLCGNGGSCADCEHISGELMKGFLSKRALSEEKRAEMKTNCPEIADSVLDSLQAALPAIPLTSFTALTSAFSNDVDPSLVYAQSVMALGRKGDVLIAISTSGNSKNVVEAARVARALGLNVISLTGESGGKLREISDVCICAPERETYKVQELHLPIYHYICAEIEDRLFS